jgi:uncharacterized protein YqgC (DUF456 family)
MAILLLLGVLLLALFLIPLGLPGTWVMVIAAFGYNYMVPGDPVGTPTVLGVAVLALVAEFFEFTLAARYTKKYGGSRRAGWGAILGGFVGAVVGVPVPIIGSVIGAFAGAFVGAWLMERSRGDQAGDATRVATGALLGRVAAAALKVGIGFVMLVWIVGSAWVR